MFLFELAGRKFTNSAIEVVIGSDTWLADGLLYQYTAPGTQDAAKGDPYELQFLHGQNEFTYKTLMQSGSKSHLGRDLTVQETEFNSSTKTYSNPVTRYKGKCAGMSARVTQAGYLLVCTFVSLLHTPNLVQPHMLTDEYQRAIDSDDDFLKFAVRARESNWGNV